MEPPLQRLTCMSPWWGLKPGIHDGQIRGQTHGHACEAPPTEVPVPCVCTRERTHEIRGTVRLICVRSVICGGCASLFCSCDGSRETPPIALLRGAITCKKEAAQTPCEEVLVQTFPGEKKQAWQLRYIESRAKDWQWKWFPKLLADASGSVQLHSRESGSHHWAGGNRDARTNISRRSPGSNVAISSYRSVVRRSAVFDAYLKATTGRHHTRDLRSDLFSPQGSLFEGMLLKYETIQYKC